MNPKSQQTLELLSAFAHLHLRQVAVFGSKLRIFCIETLQNRGKQRFQSSCDFKLKKECLFKLRQKNLISKVQQPKAA